MADAVKAVTADTLRQPFVWPGVHVGSRLKRGMEGRVEYRDLRHVRTEYPIHGLDRFELQAIVRRRKFHLLSDRPAHIGSDDRGVPIRFAAVNDTVADGVDRRSKTGHYWIQHGVWRLRRSLPVDLFHPLRALRFKRYWIADV